MGTETATEIDRTAIIGVVLDYFEGWFSGDAARMERALHPELCKRSFARDPDGTERLETLTAPQMVGWTKEGIGRTRLPEDGDPGIEIEVVDTYDTIATVMVRSKVYREYLHLVRTSEGWKIANALWARVSNEAG